MIPGFCDLQVNGFRGVDFSSPSLSLEQIQFVSQELCKIGVIGYCPTIITSPLEVYERNLPLLVKASECEEGAQILGVHLEGPFINPMYGPRGVHPQKYVLSPSIKLFERLKSWAQNEIAIFTLAPEVEGAFPLIEHIVSTTNTVVSIGHLNATSSAVQHAIDLGVRAATHVGNGLADMIPRHGNPLWAILADPRVYGLFITDGSHLPAEMVRVCLRAKGPTRFIATSDIVHLAGLPPGNYDFHGTPVDVRPDGAIRRSGASQHAGAGVPLLDCMNFLASLGEFDSEDLLKVGYYNPLSLLNRTIDEARIAHAPRLAFAANRFFIEEHI
jgi:N-acetylglucosamine-6-phosphate deacetylase